MHLHTQRESSLELLGPLHPNQGIGCQQVQVASTWISNSSPIVLVYVVSLPCVVRSYI